ncbi:hypothetical protein Nepgr_033185 [Nepenthes gracilis]|uniref:Uncharacterized protein n=1 Tax=Nepenthes gracilis TaxID=150966 RepID=A0AAD3TKY5_NEPGR|nr:hypothetical protein Nepgr_033185 [Nepenthes gracilis]
MERSEHSLVPGWLRSTGNGTGDGSSSHHFASSHSDRCLFSNSQRGSVSGLTKLDKNSYSRSHSSFTGNHRDREEERLTISDLWDGEYSDPLRCMLSGRIEKDTLRRSQSVVSRIHGEVLQRRVSADSSSICHINSGNGNGALSVGSVVTGIQKVTFDKDFPSLVSEERPATSEVSRVTLPGLSRGVHSLSTGNSAFIGSEGWTSALADVPIGVPSSSIGFLSSLKPPAATPSSGAASTTNGGLSMAEALVQTPSRSHITPQPYVQNQQFEELAVLHSKRLVPMTPSMAKNSVPNASDKLKPKTAPRSTEPAVTSKNGQLNNHSLRVGNISADSPKASQTGKLFFLKPGCKNGVAAALKDATSPTTNVNNRLLSDPCNPKPFAVGRKAQVQSRTDFFNSVRQKSLNRTSVSADSSHAVSSIIVEKSDEEHDDVASRDQVSQCPENELSFCHSTNEEEEFLRSMGWDPSAGDDEGLTEEEISSFCQKFKSRHASKLSHGLQLKILT